MDPLRAVSRCQWAQLRDLYLANWPFGVEGYCFLDTLLSNPCIASCFNITVYCPHGDIRQGMIAVSNVESYHLYIFPIELDNLECLRESLLQTSVVDWRKDIIVPSVMPEVMKIIDVIGGQLKLEVKCNGFVIKYFYSKDAPAFVKLDHPPCTHVGPLKCEHLDIVDTTWTFHSPSSKQYFRRLMDCSQTYVLYSDYDVPMAWVNVDEMGALSHLYSLEGCRRLGYGSYITKVAVNDMLSKRLNVLTYALADNFTAQKLFVKLGFQNLGLTSWVIMSKKNSKTPSCSFCRVLDFYPVIKE